MSQKPKKISWLAVFMLTLITIFGSGMWPAGGQAKLTNQSKLYLKNLGPVAIGMTIDQASKASGYRLVSSGDGMSCYYVTPEKGPQDVGFMITGGRISRIDIWKESLITTASSVKVGDTEGKVKSIYGAKIKVTPHKYVQGGHYLTFIPQDAVDRNLRLIFETDDKRVTMFRSGKIPEVEFVEGCA
ncbi:MAG TPA: hypothetical protein V6D13_16080 [Halomicronema sp.]